jgi:hypothetical protein
LWGLLLEKIGLAKVQMLIAVIQVMVTIAII